MVAAPKGGTALNTTRFHSTLGNFQRRWRLGILMSGLLQIAGWLGFALLAFGLLDYYAGFNDPTRRIIAGLLGTVAGLGVVHALWNIFIFRQRPAAAEADRSLKSLRREVLSAFELQEAPEGGAPLTLWLQQRALDRAAASLESIPFPGAIPIDPLRARAKRLLALLAVIVLCFIVAPAATGIIARRLLQPYADIPPYSALKFALRPTPAEVIYGGEILIQADISGAPLKAPVRCLTRDQSTGKIEETPAFQENQSRFSRKLEKVAAPLDIAFAVGRARSAWMPVAVRTQPKVQEVILTVDPPAYSGLPRREFALGTVELTALPGSRITARVLSNRPLSGGTLQLQAIGSVTQEKEIAGIRDESHRVRFEWTARAAGRITLEIHDVLGTGSGPVQLEQKLIRDGRPEVVIREPAADVLATPETELPLEGSVTDDLELKRVTLVRQLKGYRERSLAQPVAPGRRFELSNQINLAPFGLVAGQTLELILEGADTNPNLLGVSVSEPVRVHIITTEKYAELLRARSTLEEFSGRYEALQGALEEARKALEELEKAAGGTDPEAAETARAKALEAHEKAGEFFGKIAKDFQIFDLDNALAESALEAMKPLFENAKQLKELWRANPDELLGAIPELKKRLGASEKEIAPALEQGERAVAAGKVFEQAARFSELIEQQRGLVKDLNRALEQIRRGETSAGQALGDLARDQAEIAAGLRQMEKEMGEAVDQLPEEFSKMKEEGVKFLEALRDMEIPPTMDESVKAGEAADSSTASARAGEALAKLEALLRKKNGICEMCRGSGDQFPWPEDLSQTLQQLLRALIPKPGSGDNDGQNPGPGSMGPGGHSDSGFLMRGKMPQLPIYGPPRTRFSSRAGGIGSAQGDGKGNPERGAEVGVDQTVPAPAKAPSVDAAVIEAVPEAYREAVKRYFSTDSLNPAPTSPAPATK